MQRNLQGWENGLHFASADEIFTAFAVEIYRKMFIRKLPRLCFTYRYFIYSTTLISIVLMHYLFKLRILCWDLHAKENADQVCDLFETGAASGNLCMPLCIRQEIQSISCYSYRSTRKVKFRGKYRGTEIVFKSPTQTSPFHWYDNGKLKYPTEKQFQTTLKAVIKNKLNIDLPINTIMRITNIKFHSKEENVEARRKEMDSLSTLVQDDEFLILSIFPGNVIFPRLIGTCGAFYATEYLEPVKFNSALLSLTDDINEWIQRLQISAQILELLKKLQAEFHEPIHLCDIELQHFGTFSEDESLRFLDLDHVYPRSIVSRILGNIPCKTDEDCDFYDCRSKCDVATKTCRNVANDNFQIVCEKIFLGWRRSNTVIVPGLLMSQHTPSDLAAVLRQCSNPGHEIGKARISPEESTTKRLYELIVEIEQTVVSQMS